MKRFPLKKFKTLPVQNIYFPVGGQVVVGRWTRGAPGLKSCPLLPGEEFRRYNSLVDKEADPHIFVVQVTCADSLPL